MPPTILYAGSVQYSPEYKLASDQLHFWQLAVSRREGKPMDSTYFDRAKAAAQLDVHTRVMSLSELRQKRYQALRERMTFQHDKHGLKSLNQPIENESRPGKNQ